MGERVTGSELARRGGVSQPYISQLLTAGRIERGADGLIDAEHGLAVLLSVRPKADGKHGARRPAPGARVDAPPPAQEGAGAAQPAPAAPDSRPAQSSPAGAYTMARAYRESTLAKIESVNYRRMIGELAEVAEFRRGLTDALTPLVRELRALPDRIGGRMHAEANERRARELLAGEIERSLARIAAVVLALPEAVGKTRQ